MPQLDSLVFISQSQLVLLFIFFYYIFLFKIMPILFIHFSIANEFIVFKYYKHENNVDLITKSLLSTNRNFCYCLMFISYLEKYEQTTLTVYLGE